MGISMGIQYKTIKDKERGDCVKCVPDKKYRTFPRRWMKEPFSLLLNFTHQKVDADNIYWWTDAQFLPHDDTVLFVTSGAFEPRSQNAWVNLRHAPNGRVIKMDLDRNKLGKIVLLNYIQKEINDRSYRNRLKDLKKIQGGEIFSHTKMTNLPKLHMHPSGNYIGYISPESIKIETIEHVDVFNKHKDLRMCNYRFISFAPNGQLMAVLMSCSKQFELLVSMIDKGFAFNDRVVDLSRLLPGFRISHYNEHVECKWSPDSQFIAVCSSINYMFVLNKNLQLVLNIVSDVLPDEVFPSWASTFDFNPCSCHEILAVGTNDRCVYFLNIESKEIVQQTDALSRDAIDCLQYHPFGKYVVMATRNFSIFLLDPCDGVVLHHFDMHSESPNLKQIVYSVPNLIRLSFSTTGNQLATSSSDGKIRVYQMPQYLSLFDLCKWAIFSQVPCTKLNDLPLPSQIVTRLQSYPSMK